MCAHETSYLPWGFCKNAATRSTLTGWNGVKATEVDDRTVAFTLPAVYAPFPHALRYLPILPEHVLRDVEPAQLRENNFSVKPVGSGPFALKLLQEVDKTNGRKILHLVRNESYFDGSAKLSRIQLHVYKDADSIKRALATSEVNAASDLSLSAAASVNNDRYEIENHAVNSGVYALMNTESTVLKDKLVRQALQVGTDTQAVRDAISDKLPALDIPLLEAYCRAKFLLHRRMMQTRHPRYSIKPAGNSRVVLALRMDRRSHLIL